MKKVKQVVKIALQVLIILTKEEQRHVMLSAQPENAQMPELAHVNVRLPENGQM